MIQIKLRLASSTKKKSEKLGIDKQEPNLWLVQGSSGQYETTFNPEDQSFVCYKADGNKQLCQGWKFCQGSGVEKQCKHILAVVIKSDEFELIEDNVEEKQKNSEPEIPEYEPKMLTKSQKF